MPTTPDPQTASTRDNLRRAALDLFASHGYHRTRIAEIVQRCGLTQAAFYWHFDSKLGLALELIAEGREAMLATLRRGYRQRIDSVQDMVDNSQRWIAELLQFAQDNRQFMAILLARGHGADVQVDRAIGETRTAIYDALHANIARAVELGMLPAAAVDLRAGFVHRLIEGSIEWWLFGHDYDLEHRPHVDAATLAAQLVRFEFFGLSGAAAAAQVRP